MKNIKKYLNLLLYLCLILIGSLIWGQLKNFGTSLARDKNAPLELKEALHWISLDKGRIQCQLCPRRCVLSEGEKGFCRARKNIKGRLYALTYGQPVALHVDPIEKKPLAHVYPGTKSFSIATAGCNLRCKFCQNWEISQLDPETVAKRFVPPQEIISLVKSTGSKTIAFTYTEPTIFYEYMLDIAKLAKEENISLVMHSAGYINEEPLRQIAKYLKAANIDLKGFSDKYYASFCQGSLNEVLNTLKILREEGVWLEITTLLIPGGNDSDEEIRKMCEWIVKNLGKDTPVHFSRFFPMYKLINLSPTPLSTLVKAKKIAEESGLNFVYIGNVPEHLGEDTNCPHCHKLLIKRIGYRIIENNIKEGRCLFCKEPIPGIWE